MHTCTQCDREFSNFDTAGKCPVCGEYQKVACSSCGYSGGAKRFIDNGSKCTKCDKRVKIPGQGFPILAAAGMLFIAGFAVWFLMRMQQYFASVN